MLASRLLAGALTAAAAITGLNASSAGISPPRMQVTVTTTGPSAGNRHGHLTVGDTLLAVAVRDHGGLGTGSFGEALEAAVAGPYGYPAATGGPFSFPFATLKATRAAGTTRAVGKGVATSMVVPVDGSPYGTVYAEMPTATYGTAGPITVTASRRADAATDVTPGLLAINLTPIVKQMTVGVWAGRWQPILGTEPASITASSTVLALLNAEHLAPWVTIRGGTQTTTMSCGVGRDVTTRTTISPTTLTLFPADTGSNALAVVKWGAVRFVARTSPAWWQTAYLNAGGAPAVTSDGNAGALGVLASGPFALNASPYSLQPAVGGLSAVVAVRQPALPELGLNLSLPSIHLNVSKLR